jgi:hypothetical protein
MNSRGVYTSTGFHDATIETMAETASLANRLAKRLDGPSRTAVYQVKADACSLLLVNHWALVDGVRPGGVVGLTILSAARTRVHVPTRSLSAEARAIVRAQSSTAPATAPISDYLAAHRVAA